MLRLPGLLIFCCLLLAAPAPSQTAAPALDVTLWVSNEAGSTVALHFGLDPRATDGIDPALGEIELPPYPPSDAFDARFVGADIGVDLKSGVQKDYRYGTLPASGVTIYELRYQLGAGTGLSIRWNLPAGITARVQDLVTGALIDNSLSGADSAAIPKSDLVSKLRVTVTWSTSAVSSPFGTESVPARASLSRNYPNPFNPATVIPFRIPAESRVRIEVFSVTGELVEELLDQTLPAGSHQVAWRPHVSSGAYFARMTVRPMRESNAPEVHTISMIFAR